MHIKLDTSLRSFILWLYLCFAVVQANPKLSLIGSMTRHEPLDDLPHIVFRADDWEVAADRATALSRGIEIGDSSGGGHKTLIF